MIAGELKDLCDDGDILELEGGRKLRLRIEPDQDAAINDYDSYGKVGWGRQEQYGRGELRPADFDGAAEKLGIYDHGVSLWWQPPKGEMALTVERGSEEWREYLQFIKELAEWGFKSVGLELLEGEDAYKRPIVKQVAWLGAIDSVEGGYLLDIVKDLAAELGLKEGGVEWRRSWRTSLS